MNGRIDTHKRVETRMIKIEARNNLNIPIRLTATNVNDGRNESRILITIGKEGVKLSGFYGVCIDVDLSPNEEWEEIGRMNLETEHRISISGIASV